MSSDYTSGDVPVPVGTMVRYHDRVYEVVEHQEPREGTPDPVVSYPDGVAYVLWPVDVPKKFGNRDQSFVQVRRESFVVTGVAP